MSYLTNYQTMLSARNALDEKDRIKAEIRKNFLNPSYAKVNTIDVLGNEVEKEVQTTKSKGEHKERLVLSHPDQPLQSGMILENLRGHDWLTYSIEQVGEINQEVKIIKMNMEIKWMDGEIVQTSNCAIISKGGDPTWERFFSTPEGVIACFLPATDINKRLPLNKRFFINSFPFQVVKITDYEYDNVIVLTLKESLLTANDINGVCDFINPAPVVVNKIEGSDTIRQGRNRSYSFFMNDVQILDAVWDLSPIDANVVLTTNLGIATVTVSQDLSNIGKTFTLSATKDATIISKTITIVSLM